MRYVLPLVLAIGCASCASSSRPNSVASQPPQHAGPVIAGIAARHDCIVIRAGDSGPTYSLETARGEVLVPDMTLGKLAAANPELFQWVTTLEDSVLWAGQ
jgi:hypothetical protein